MSIKREQEGQFLSIDLLTQFLTYYSFPLSFLFVSIDLHSSFFLSHDLLIPSYSFSLTFSFLSIDLLIPSY